MLIKRHSKYQILHYKDKEGREGGAGKVRASVASTKESVETDTEAKSAAERVDACECYGSSTSCRDRQASNKDLFRLY